MKIKNIFKSKELGYLLLALLWFYPAVINYGYDYYLKDLIFNIAFLVSIFLVVILKNKKESLISAFVIAAAVCVYDFSYIFAVLPAELLIVSYKYIIEYINEKDKKRESKDTGEILLTVSSILIVFSLGYIFYIFDPEKNIGLFFNKVRDSLWILAFFIFMFVMAVKNKAGEKNQNYKKTTGKLKTVYIYALAGFVETLIISYFASFSYVSVFSRSYSFYWFIFIELMFYYKDPFIMKVNERMKGKTIIK